MVSCKNVRFYNDAFFGQLSFFKFFRNEAITHVGKDKDKEQQSATHSTCFFR